MAASVSRATFVTPTYPNGIGAGECCSSHNKSAMADQEGQSSVVPLPARWYPSLGTMLGIVASTLLAGIAHDGGGQTLALGAVAGRDEGVVAQVGGSAAIAAARTCLG